MLPAGPARWPRIRDQIRHPSITITVDPYGQLLPGATKDASVRNLYATGTVSRVPTTRGEEAQVTEKTVTVYSSPT